MAADDIPPSPLHDANARTVQRTIVAGLVLGAMATGGSTVLHWLRPTPEPVDRFVPLLLSIAFAGLAARQWRRPEHMASTLWVAWWLAIAGMALPSAWFVARSVRSGELLVELLPPFGAMLPMVLIGMALFARPRLALWSTLSAWAIVALPVLAYLAMHPAQLETPRGLELALAFGPGSLFVPLLVPVLRSVGERFHALRREGERLQELAERDVLIGLYNRRAGERFLGTLLAHARHDAALLLFDIDHFKRINDEHGHPVGDRVLIEVGRRCAAQLGRDDIFARWGGEEFLVVLPRADAAAGAMVADRLRRAIHAEPIEGVGPVSASFGVTGLRAGDTLAEVVQRADEALYRAKSGGRNRVVSG
jgi:diguanylate cyclase (GGDEF)-like protein